MIVHFDEFTFGTYLDVIVSGIAAGFTIGFIAWGIGFAFYGIIKFFKHA